MTPRPDRGASTAPTRILRRFHRCRSGAVAAEFALVGPVFIALLIAIVQTSVVFLVHQVLVEATAQASRLIMTGQAQMQQMTAADFIKDVCDQGGGILDCSRLSTNVQTFASFQAVARSNPIQNGVFNQNDLVFDPGVKNDIVLVQVFYELPVVAAPFGFTLANVGSNTDLIMATAVFRNEPY